MSLSSGSSDTQADYTTGELDSRVDRYFGDEKDRVLSRKYQVIKYVEPVDKESAP